jgi:hypothetical protein
MILTIQPDALSVASRVARNFTTGNAERWGCPREPRVCPGGGLVCENPPAYVTVRNPDVPGWNIQTPCREHAPNEKSGTYLIIPI